MYVAVEQIGVGSFGKLYVCVSDGLQLSEAVVGAFQVSGAEGLSFLNPCVLRKRSFSEREFAVVASCKVYAAYGVACMQRVAGAVCRSEFVEVQCNVHQLFPLYGVGGKGYEVFVEMEISVVCQHGCNPLPLSVQLCYVEWHPLLEPHSLWVYAFHLGGNAVVFYVICHIINMV